MIVTTEVYSIVWCQFVDMTSCFAIPHKIYELIFFLRYGVMIVTADVYSKVWCQFHWPWPLFEAAALIFSRACEHSNKSFGIVLICVIQESHNHVIKGDQRNAQNVTWQTWIS